MFYHCQNFIPFNGWEIPSHCAELPSFVYINRCFKNFFLVCIARTWTQGFINAKHMLPWWALSSALCHFDSSLHHFVGISAFAEGLNKAAFYVCVLVFVWLCFASVEYLPKSGIVVLYDSCNFEELPGCVQCSHTSSCSSSHLCWHLSFLIGDSRHLCGRRHLIVVLICISLMTKDVEHPFLAFIGCLIWRNVYL